MTASTISVPAPEKDVEIGEGGDAACLRDPGREPRVEVDERGQTHAFDLREARHVLRPLGAEADDADSQDFLHCGALLITHQPPSTMKLWPVIMRLSSAARKSTMREMSSG